MEGNKGRVCVTGGAGFIASWIIKKLLQDDYSVNTTVRSNPEHEEDASFLYNLPGASERLHVFNADLTDPGSFRGAIEGCIGVFHVASQIDTQLREPEEIVTKRSIDGALGILKACLDSKTVKRVVYTSSSSAVSLRDKEDGVKDESFWSDIDYLRSSKILSWLYAVSKTLTEKAMLEFGEQNGLDVVSVIPPLVFGPFITPKLPKSVFASLCLTFGTHSIGYALPTPMVHVDDLARAQIFLLEHPNPKGRYICSSCYVTVERVSDLVSSRYPEFQQQTADSFKRNQGIKLPNYSSRKLIDVGFVFKYGIEEMLDDAIQCCKQKGVAVI